MDALSHFLSRHRFLDPGGGATDREKSNAGEKEIIIFFTLLVLSSLSFSSIIIPTGEEINVYFTVVRSLDFVSDRFGIHNVRYSTIPSRFRLKSSSHTEKVLLVLVKAMKNPRNALCKSSIMATSNIFKSYGDKLLESTTCDAIDHMVKHVNALASELANTTTNEGFKINQCKDLLSIFTHMESNLSKKTVAEFVPKIKYDKNLSKHFLKKLKYVFVLIPVIQRKLSGSGLGVWRAYKAFEKFTRPMLGRKELLKNTLKKAANAWKLIVNLRLSEEESKWLRFYINEPTYTDLHWGLFIPAIEGQGIEEQKHKWLPLAQNMQIIGCYAQT
uniref:Acyl-coenzyme A oxidase N-terminal domain-containing protein n=1 Tax=Lactuca sativa TaxID=4236 RepID=A0A9R1VJ94_LACSA|nr:hypothetical protein LSAT_V11C500264390 [Lactuca sativa]